jgi:hypothetical protein
MSDAGDAADDAAADDDTSSVGRPADDDDATIRNREDLYDGPDRSKLPGTATPSVGCMKRRRARGCGTSSQHDVGSYTSRALGCVVVTGVSAACCGCRGAPESGAWRHSVQVGEASALYARLAQRRASLSASRTFVRTRYCGVSYLVFSEVKDLERRTLAAEAQMASWAVRMRCATTCACVCQER